MAGTLRVQLLIVVLCVHGLPSGLLAQSQMTTTSFAANGGQAASGQQQPAQSPMQMGMDPQSYSTSAAYYRPDVPPPAVGYPADQNYFGGFNAGIGAGFNKGFGFRVPDALSGAGYYNGNMHSPLGELWAVKADLIPAIFKTGLVITVIIVIFKVLAFLVYAKHNALLAAGSALAGSAGSVGIAPVPAAVSSHVPVVSVLAERTKSGAEESSNKIKRDAGPVVDAETDFDAMLAQLESIRSHFEDVHQN